MFTFPAEKVSYDTQLKFVIHFQMHVLVDCRYRYLVPGTRVDKKCLHALMMKVDIRYDGQWLMWKIELVVIA